jgi:hypothetical protein
MFFDKRDLRRHVDEVHLKVRNYTCHLCPKSFSKSCNLNTHIETVHQKLQKFVCDVCDERFFAKRYLQKHVQKVHAPDQPQQQQQLQLATANDFHSRSGF